MLVVYWQINCIEMKTYTVSTMREKRTKKNEAKSVGDSISAQMIN